MERDATTPAPGTLFSFLREWLIEHDPRPFIRCETCFDFGMIENDRGEDTCPTCEGGIWRERIPWRRWAERQELPLLRLRVGFWGRVPTIYRSWDA